MAFEEIISALRLAIDKMNRVEANIAHYLSSQGSQSSSAKAKCDDALDAIDAALEAQAKTNRMLASMAAELRRGR